MKRDPRLRRLSSEHHRALLLARKTAAATAANAYGHAARALLAKTFDEAIEPHFRLEEDALVPALREAGEPALAARVEREHAALRKLAAAARAGDDDAAAGFAALLGDHVRFEEREFFPRCEEKLPPDILASVEGGSPPPSVTPKVSPRQQIQDASRTPPPPSPGALSLFHAGKWRGHDCTQGTYLEWDPAEGAWQDHPGSTAMSDPALLEAFHRVWAARCRDPAGPRTWRFLFLQPRGHGTVGIETFRLRLMGEGFLCRAIGIDQDGEASFSATRKAGLTRDELLAMNETLRRMASAAEVEYTGPLFPEPG